MTKEQTGYTQAAARVRKRETLAAGIHRLTLEAEEIAARARPGQFVMLQAGEGLDPLLNRPFSIHQVTAAGWVQILFKEVGKGTRMLARAQPGQRLGMVGPLGKGFTAGPEPAPTCLIGGGMGIAPLYFLAKEQIRRKPEQELRVLLGARNRDELAPLAAEFQDLGLPVAMATDDGSLGHHGLVIDLLQELTASPARWQVLCCGPYPMMRAVARLCREQGFSCQVSLETMMACGIGACLGCAFPAADRQQRYLHVCKDGPVLNAEEIAWR